MSIFISGQGLVKNYGDFSAVRGISFDVHEGEIFGLLGPNGAGKSTTISMMIGLFKPTAGSVTIAGFDLYQNLRQLKSIIGYVPQELALYDPLTARDNMNLFGKLYGLGGMNLRKRIDYLLEVVGLTEWANKKVKTFSGGMKRRLNLAAAVIHSPRLLCLDEPTVGVDPQSRNRIFEMVKELAGNGTSILYTTHYMEEVEALCDEVAIVDEGKIIAQDTCENLLRIAENETIEVAVAGLQLLGSIEGGRFSTIKEFEFKNNIIYLKAPSVVAAMGELADFLKERELEIHSIRMPKTNLETVFLKLTGKDLRQ
ncbi:MAG: ABC transporter ATP-binding protein [Candidatus Saccharibacteria bacterium]